MRIGDMKIRIAACGVACEICQWFKKGMCPGCYPGTDEAAPGRLKFFGKVHVCPALECAIKKKVDHCLNCDEFPCDVLFKSEEPYSKKLLYALKEFRNIVEKGGDPFEPS